MDESWRKCSMGMSTAHHHHHHHHLPRRNSMENANTFSMAYAAAFSDQALAADDFSDVFGGPPRSVLCRKLSGDFTRSASFYEEVFRPPEFVSTRASKGGRVLPAFRIPAGGEGFYSDIFGSDDDQLRRSRERSRSNSKPKSKSNSSSVLSSEELSPLRPAVGEDVGLSSFASKLRPINVPCRWNSSTRVAAEQEAGAGSRCSTCLYNIENSNYMENHEYGSGLRKRSSLSISSMGGGGGGGGATSPEIISLEVPHSFRTSTVKISADDLDDDEEFNYSSLTPMSSPASSLYHHHHPFSHHPTTSAAGMSTSVHSDHSVLQQQQPILQQQEHEDDDDDDDDDEVMSSYVIEINSDFRDQYCSGDQAVLSIDEAIAWAKERYNNSTQTSESSSSSRPEQHEKHPNTSINNTNNSSTHAHAHAHGPAPKEEEQQTKSKAEDQENEKSEQHIKMGVLDEDVKLWSTGKETNIRLLLSTLHHILWPNSGWHVISLTSLKESSQVKKAYQKARLCLHPDKLQQRGATCSQKYVAQKAFTILQDAWAAFVSQDVFFK